MGHGKQPLCCVIGYGAPAQGPRLREGRHRRSSAESAATVSAWFYMYLQDDADQGLILGRAGLGGHRAGGDVRERAAEAEAGGHRLQVWARRVASVPCSRGAGPRHAAPALA